MKRRSRSLVASLILVAVGFAAREAVADVTLPAVIDSHMVVQRDAPIVIWGWAEAGEKVTVKMGDATQTATADAEGNWKVSLPAQKADSKPRTIAVSGKNKIELEDILIGEVWIGSGQSNMEWPLTETHGGQEAISAAGHLEIRLFHVPKVQVEAPAKDVVAEWKACSPETVGTFSAVLYYFGLKLHEELDVPIGLINSSWGGSPIEPWTIAGGQSGGMYNGMIAPLVPFALRGAIWYQGETNVLQKNGLAYSDKMRALIEGWRGAFDNEMPFLYVQIAPWEGSYEPGELPALWEGQVASLKIPGTGMIVTTDLVDDIKDIHPRNKLDVGNRLALWALAKTYGKNDLAYSGPLYSSMSIQGDEIRIQFAHAHGGLKSRDDKPLTEFEIADSNDEFVPAEATIDGETVIVKAEGIKRPLAVRFGWHNLAMPNLANAAGLPASPFRTSEWQGGTGE